ncbi:MAG: phosphonopyruvate decarboxylase [Lachnospiraceae bacterium]|nr:phosphonopyruvate decarboxylase [Lachnospiraceae bacterium]
MRIEDFCNIVGADFYTGVPDSQLKCLCDYLIDRYGTEPGHHVIAANEGNCTAIAAGYYLSTGETPVVYLQNSGEGNIINPMASLLSDEVYAIPVIFVIGWRGEPGIHDEPQHIYQGKVTIQLLDDMAVKSFVIDKYTTGEDLRLVMKDFRKLLAAGRSVAFIIRKEAFSYEGLTEYKNNNVMRREDVISHIVKISEEDPIVSTTGKASRELFEIREKNGQSHNYDFLTVGSMGHASSIALGIAIHRPKQRIWCIDGDGAALMHMGAMAVLGSYKPANLLHILINNGAHESVGGMPAVSDKINMVMLAKACGYPYAVSVSSFEQLDKELRAIKEKQQLCFLEIKCSLDSRADLGRPTTTPLENKKRFMDYLEESYIKFD